MPNHAALVFSSLLLVAAAIALACGSPSSSQSSTRTLTSITVSPASPEAANYPDGEVPLSATGFFNLPPSPVTPISVQWGTCTQAGMPAEVSVTLNGIAQCAPGAVGTFPVTATVPPSNTNVMCGALMACGSSGTDCAGVHGAAKLTCP